ncbi:unannotated protein [freshwater metagenome]|uniref:Unannotated protein n=1 Tax=freshwater metagenome TaxID=449393 RepID=A0A6J7CIQ8_9ZZZZ
MKTGVLKDNYYLVHVTIQARAAKLSEAAALWLSAKMASTVPGSKFSNIIVLPSHGINDKGQIIQTLQVSGLFRAGEDAADLGVTLSEKSGKKLTSLTGVIELTKINYIPIMDSPATNLVVTKAAATKAAATKAAATKAAATKAAATKAAATKAAATKAAAAKAKAAAAKASSKK